MTDAFAREMTQRHDTLLESLGDDVLIVASGVPPSGVGLFMQDSTFHYLTGFPEQGAVVVFDASQDAEPVTLFVKAKDRREEVWQGFTIGVKAAQETFPVSKTYDVRKLESVLEDRLNGRTVYYKAVQNHPREKRLDSILKQDDIELRSKGGPFEALLEMRAVKSAWELEQMRRAIAITGEAHHACMRTVGRHGFEYQLEAEFEYACKLQGVRHFAFGAIVAAGTHATCQHYVENNGSIADGDLVLIDSGAKWNMYCADITRTFPASGTFSPAQRDFYEVVLASQKAGVEAVRPGVTLHELNNTAARVLIDGLRELKVLFGDTEEIVEKSAYREFWPGGLSHSLGLDVHDGLPKGYGGADAEKPLSPGMVITVEPGFYSQDFNHQIPDELRHIGIRIEDDVLVTEDGHQNLSCDIVKELADVEAMVQSGG